MAEYEQLNSIYSIDGKNYAVDLFSWANIALTGNDLAQFQSDMAVFIAELQQQENITVIPIKEYITTTHLANIGISIGIKVTRSPDYQIDPRRDYWAQRMQQDPRIVKYNPEVRIS